MLTNLQFKIIFVKITNNINQLSKSKSIQILYINSKKENAVFFVNLT